MRSRANKRSLDANPVVKHVLPDTQIGHLLDRISDRLKQCVVWLASMQATRKSAKGKIVCEDSHLFRDAFAKRLSTMLHDEVVFFDHRK
jgi:hypothetical protein